MSLCFWVLHLKLHDRTGRLERCRARYPVCPGLHDRTGRLEIIGVGYRFNL